MQTWKKLGRIFHVDANHDWMLAHASVPTLEPLGDGNFRVYFGSRNAANQSSIGFFEFHIDRPTRVTRISERPVLTPGELGAFDDSGVWPCWHVEHKGKKFLYYIGWNLGVTVPFRNFTGLAIADGSGAYQRVSRAPIADRDESDPFFFTSPCVLWENGKARIWYLSTVRWCLENGEARHYYHIKQDESADGIHWERKPTVAIDFRYEGEYAISRPCVLRDRGGYQMFYSYRASPRGTTYRIGYAESPDGKTWTRKDEEVGLDVSESGWDSKMIEYPQAFDHEGRRYMLYNGDGFGKTGIGLAVLEQD